MQPGFNAPQFGHNLAYTALCNLQMYSRVHSQFTVERVLHYSVWILGESTPLLHIVHRAHSGQLHNAHSLQQKAQWTEHKKQWTMNSEKWAVHQNKQCKMHREAKHWPPLKAPHSMFDTAPLVKYHHHQHHHCQCQQQQHHQWNKKLCFMSAFQKQVHFQATFKLYDKPATWNPSFLGNQSWT